MNKPMDTVPAPAWQWSVNTQFAARAYHRMLKLNRATVNLAVGEQPHRKYLPTINAEVAGR